MKCLNQSKTSSLLMRYSRLLAEHPFAVLCSVAIIFVILISLPFITHQIPDFSDPQLGFESRHTEISSRLAAWDNLVESTRTSGLLTLNPSELYHSQDRPYMVQFSDGRKKGGHKSKVWGKSKKKLFKGISNHTAGNLVSNKEEEKPFRIDGSDFDEDDDDLDADENSAPLGNSFNYSESGDFFCGEPSSDYARVVLSSTNGENLFTYDSLVTMCHLEHKLLVGNGEKNDLNEKYQSLCQRSTSGTCCRPWSLPNYIALLFNHSSCMDISENDVIQAIDTLNQCRNAYNGQKFYSGCYNNENVIGCHDFPIKCSENNWVYNIFHFLADKEFFKPGNEEGQKTIPFLRHAMIFLPMACSTATMPYYSAIRDSMPLTLNGIQVEAMELGLRDSLFDYHLIQDSWLLIGVAVAIGTCMWLYSGSFLIALASIISIPLSLGLSYTAYKYIFCLSFFPFLNMVAAVISLGIGVDDAFIFCKMWRFLKDRASLPENRVINCDKNDIELQIEVKFEGSSHLTSPNVSETNNGEPSHADAAQENSSRDHDEDNGPVIAQQTSPLVVDPGGCDIEGVSEDNPESFDEDDLDDRSGVNRSAESRLSRSNARNLKSGSIDLIVCETLKLAFQSMFVTSFTTAVAFYLSYSSRVTAIRCFSIFAGTAVITNFLLMLTWFPAAVVIAERLKMCTLMGDIFNRLSLKDAIITSPFFSFLCELHKKCSILINDCDTMFNISKRWAWICVISLGSVSVISVVISSYYPGLHPMNELQFQLLHSSHIFERYQHSLRLHFNFEPVMNSIGGDEEFGLPLRFVFGVLPLDKGDPLNPASRVPFGNQAASNLHFSDDFDLSSRQGQTWLLKFCQSIRSQPFYGSNTGPLLGNCFIETFKKWMSRRCIEPVEMVDRSPCCEVSEFPYTRKVFRKCLMRALSQLHKTPHLLYHYRGESAGPRFLKTEPHRMVTAVIEYESNVPFTTSFVAMHEFYNSVESWMNEQMITAPRGLKCGWFISNLNFYDLQLTLSTGVLGGICISLGVSGITMLVFTCNVVKSILTALSIASATSVALATLTLLGWSLGPVESLTLSLAVGLSADFALHYAICHRNNSVESKKCYRKCKFPNGIMALCDCRKEEHSCKELRKVNGVVEECSVEEFELENDLEITSEPFVGVPATLAATTTVIAGALMLSSSVVAYNQVGIFLIVLISASWFYSTFFLLSLLKLFQAV